MNPVRKFCVAPMMDWTDRHERYFLRLITRRAVLYTEMLTAEAVLRGERDRLLGFDSREHPLALQLGGASPARLAEAALIGERHGYDEINLNIGCPSDRVREGRFGACLMAEPERVRDCVAAIRTVTALPVTVKCRIGINGRDRPDDLFRFIDIVRDGGCETVIIHARSAVLGGLSPKQNREVPPLRYAVVYRAKERFPDLEIIINGGITDLDSAAQHLRHVDGVMLGRAAYQTPYCLADVDRRFFGESGPAVRPHGVIAAYLPYIRARMVEGVPLQAMSRHILGLFQGLPGARAWRRHLSTHAHRPGADAAVVADAASLVAEPCADRRAA